MITVNGVKRTLEQPLSVTEYLEKNPVCTSTGCH